MEYKDYYKTLGVDRDISQTDLKKAYRKLARKYHPDVSKLADAEERFKEVNEAYEVLGDVKKREQFDTLGANWKNGQNFNTPPGWEGGFDHGQYTRGGGHGGDGFSDFFESMFGGGGYQQGSPFQQQRKPPAETMTLYVDLEDIFSGGKKLVRLPNGQSLDIKIPKGFEDGKKIRLKGKASSGADIHLQIKISKHPRFKLDGKDVTLTLPLAPWEAALGASIAVDTLAGKIKLKIPAGSTSGKKMRLKGRGLPGTPVGDQFVLLQIETPPAETDEEVSFYEEMEKKFDWSPR